MSNFQWSTLDSLQSTPVFSAIAASFGLDSGTYIDWEHISKLMILNPRVGSVILDFIKLNTDILIQIQEHPDDPVKLF